MKENPPPFKIIRQFPLNYEKNIAGSKTSTRVEAAFEALGRLSENAIQTELESGSRRLRGPVATKTRR